MTAFFSHNFSEDRWRKAALKNAFALLGKQRFEQSAAFFLLAGSLKDAIEVLAFEKLCFSFYFELRNCILKSCSADHFHSVAAERGCLYKTPLCPVDMPFTFTLLLKTA